MTGHTPGPWKTTTLTRNRRAKIVDLLILPADGPSLAILHSASSLTQQANARLIAAAPELLQACKWALADHQPKIENLGSPCNCDRCLSLRAAIAKAEGK